LHLLACFGLEGSVEDSGVGAVGAVGSVGAVGAVGSVGAVAGAVVGGESGG